MAISSQNIFSTNMENYAMGKVFKSLLGTIVLLYKSCEKFHTPDSANCHFGFIFAKCFYLEKLAISKNLRCCDENM